MSVLITGSAGFIGFHTAWRFLRAGYKVIGIDSINKYYDPALKTERQRILKRYKNFKFYKLDISQRSRLKSVFSENKISQVIHLAAQAGVRYSLENPYAYSNSNLVGFINLLECIKLSPNIEKTIFASSSSVYGLDNSIKLHEALTASHPVSLYAATKKANEVIAHSYSHMYDLKMIGLRFFTVYGPWGRPDMALFKFTKNILEDKPIDVYNFGNMQRDFTYVDDIVEGIIRLSKSRDIPSPSNHVDTGSSLAPFRIFNIGGGRPSQLTDFIKIIERKLNKKAVINYLPMQPGDVESTFASTKNLYKAINYKPKVKLSDGVSKFIDWYLEYHKNEK